MNELISVAYARHPAAPSPPADGKPVADGEHKLCTCVPVVAVTTAEQMAVLLDWCNHDNNGAI